MNNVLMREAVQKMAKSKFRGHKKLRSKIKTHHPENLVREYIRLADAYMKILNQAVSKHMPEIKKLAEREQLENVRHDDGVTLQNGIRVTFRKIEKGYEKRVASFGLDQKLKNLGKLTRKLSIKEWKKVCKATLGIDILEDYYMGEFYRESLKRWTEENIGLIKTIPQDTLGQMQTIVQDGFKTGKTTTSIVKEIQSTYGVKKRHARLIARDQMAKLNADIAKSQQTDAGVEEYVWSDSGDGRVRSRHHFLNGKTFRWDDPPVVDVKTGRRAHPGEDYQCRCVALPNFNLNTLNIPMQGRKEEVLLM